MSHFKFYSALVLDPKPILDNISPTGSIVISTLTLQILFLCNISANPAAFQPPKL